MAMAISYNWLVLFGLYILFWWGFLSTYNWYNVTGLVEYNTPAGMTIVGSTPASGGRHEVSCFFVLKWKCVQWLGPLRYTSYKY